MSALSKVLHTIKVWLYDNLLTPDPNDFSARVSSEKSLNTAQICDSAVTRGGAQTTASAMEMNVNLFLKEMGHLMSDGYSINTGYFTANAEVKGVFTGKTDTFDPLRHTVVFQFRQGSILRRELENVKVEILGVAKSHLFVSEVLDVKSGTINDLLTPNRNLKIGGYRLKVVGDKPEVGIYFINQATQASVKVEPSEIVTNNPSELMIVIPELPAGEYKLQVTNQYSVGALLKEPRTTIFDKVLTME